MTTIKINVSAMFEDREPWDCSNSVANLGPQAARLTWACSIGVAAAHEDWLLSPLADALEFARDWAREAGAWDQDEIKAWSDLECLALLVQNVASDMRGLGADSLCLTDCAEQQQDQTGYYWNENGQVMGEIHD